MLHISVFVCGTPPFLWRCVSAPAKVSSFLRFLDHTQNDVPHLVGLLWMSDQLAAQTST